MQQQRVADSFSSGPARSFGEAWKAARAEVDAALGPWLDERIRRAHVYHDEAAVHALAVKELAVRGGKRLRPALCAAAYLAFSPERGGGGGESALTPLAPIVPALVSLELLQAYLLIHDDWMDGDEVRRGGPSTHASLGARFGSARAGAVAGILAGDLAAAYSLEALAECRVAAESLAAAVAEMGEMQHRVVLGQVLDVRGVCRGSDEVERMHDLKTGSYTVRGPLRLGAALAGANAKARAGLDAFASPIGVAFQLRDDLLGTFGEPAVTGKPRGSDLREGKRTAVVAAVAGDPAWTERLSAAARMSEAEIERLVDDLDRAGARARVEGRIRELTQAADDALAALDVGEPGRELLRGAVSALTKREH